MLPGTLHVHSTAFSPLLHEVNPVNRLLQIVRKLIESRAVSDKKDTRIRGGHALSDLRTTFEQLNISKQRFFIGEPRACHGNINPAVIMH